MTATLEPGNTPYLSIRDAAVRLDHYLSSLLLWIENSPFQEIVFCENSGQAACFGALVDWAATHSKSLEVLTFDGNEEAQQKGKGYGEGRILEYAVQRSRCIERAAAFYKVTGRLYVENIAEVIDTHAGFDNVFERGDTRFFKSSVAFFKRHLESRYREVDDAQWMSIEAVFVSALEACMPTEFCSFLVRPVVIGQSATDLCIYDKWYPTEVQERIAGLRAMIAR